MRAFIVALTVSTFFAFMAQAQPAPDPSDAGGTPTLIGRWNVQIMLADGIQRALHFEAHDAGKGTFQVVDPRLKAWGPGKPSEAKWSREDQNGVSFTGPVEFMLGNVGRDAGTLIFKGKFENTDLITGQVEFAPLVGDRPSRHGTFKAIRSTATSGE